MEKFLSRLLDVPRGITALVGAGGKTTAMLTLAQELAQSGHTVIITTTTHIFPPDPARFGQVLSPADHAALSSQLARSRVAVVAGFCNQQGKLTGLSSQQIDDLACLADYVLVEADGSRRMPCKVPAVHEPALPQHTALVVGVVGLSALGRPLSEVCFRAELAAPLLGVPPQQPLSVEGLAQIAARSWGLKKSVCGRFCLLLNQKDTCSPALLCRLAAQIRQYSDCPIVAAALQQKDWSEV